MHVWLNKRNTTTSGVARAQAFDTGKSAAHVEFCFRPSTPPRHNDFRRRRSRRRRACGPLANGDRYHKGYEPLTICNKSGGSTTNSSSPAECMHDATARVVRWAHAVCAFLAAHADYAARVALIGL